MSYYQAGTITIGAGATTFTTALTALLSQAKEGDMLVAWNGSGFGIGVLSADPVTNTDGVLANPWRGPALTDVATYLILHTGLGWDTNEGIHETAAAILARITVGGQIWIAGTLPIWDTGDAPPDELGSDGDVGIDTSTAPYTIYAKAEGGWSEGLELIGATWLTGEGAPGAGLGSNGDLYLDEESGNVSRKVSGSWTVIANLIGPVGPQGGDRYDLMISDTGRPGTGEEMMTVVMTTAVDYLSSLAGSRARAKVAATADAVFSVRKNGVQFGTITFAAAASTGTFAAATPTSLADNDLLSVVAPDPRDATLSGLSITISGSRPTTP